MLPCGQFGAASSCSASSAKRLAPLPTIAEALEHRLAALLGEAAIAVERARLRIAVGMRA